MAGKRDVKFTPQLHKIQWSGALRKYLYEKLQMNILKKNKPSTDSLFNVLNLIGKAKKAGGCVCVEMHLNFKLNCQIQLAQ